MPQLDNGLHERFCQQRALHGDSVGEAHRNAGGGGQETSRAHKRNGEKIAVRADVKARIKELLAERKNTALESVNLTEKFVVTELLRNIDDARNGVHLFQGEVVKDNTGEPIRKIDVASVGNDLKNLGKHIGMWPSVTQLALSRGRQIEGLTMKELIDSVAQNLLEATGGQVELDREMLRDVLIGKRRLPDGLVSDIGNSGELVAAPVPPAGDV